MAKIYYVHREVKSVFSVTCVGEPQLEIAKHLSTKAFVFQAEKDGGDRLSDYSWEEIRQTVEEVDEE